jgi:EAL domain-containing protein (putative c-di-GMP-specific phosphodiesterase class I)
VLPFATSSLQTFDEELAGLLPGIDGLVLVPHEQPGRFVAWCRRGSGPWEEIEPGEQGGAHLASGDHSVDSTDDSPASGSGVRADALRRGIAKGELVLHYQPVVLISEGKTLGVEALVRWNSAELGLVPPDEFIPLAELTGLIVPLGRWVIGEAVSQLGEWKRQGVVDDDFGVAINLSPTQLLDDSLVAVLDAACAEAGIIPPDVMLEITESLLVAEGSDMSDTLTRLADAGYLLSIDDFGTGHSSLSYLRYLPTSQLKLDMSFVAGLPGNVHDVALVTALIGLAHDFGMTCVAEGVETAEQLACLTNLGCDLAQGYLLGRPEPASRLDFGRV